MARAVAAGIGRADHEKLLQLFAGFNELLEAKDNRLQY